MRVKVFVTMLAAFLFLGTGIGISGAVETDETAVSSSGDEAVDENVIEDRILVAFSGAVPDWFDSWVEERNGEILVQSDKLHWAGVKLPDAAAATDAMSALETREDVRSVEREVLYELQYVDVVEGPVQTTDAVPNDPLYPDQWGYPAIGAPDAWDINLGSHDVTVAVLDTGIHGTHPDLMGNICGPHRSFVPGEPPLEDWHFHGTHVSGTVAAVSDNGIGVAGTSQSCLMDAQVCTRFGSCPSSGSIAAIEWAADNGADIISMSWGGGAPSPIMQDALAYAYSQDVLLIAAAGNSGCFGGDTVIYPAKFPEVVAVAALQNPGSDTASFSSCGFAVEVAAPGASVLSTNNNNGYRYASGTSMAAPHASGVAALIKSENPDLDAAELRCVLARTSDDILAVGMDGKTGWGRVNPVSGMNLDLVSPNPPSPGVPSPDPEQVAYLGANSCTPVALGVWLPS